MPRKRVVDPRFFKDWELYQAETSASLPLRLAYEGLWAVADREGRFEWKPEQIKTDVLPYDPVDFRQILEALLMAGFVRYYEVNGKGYGWIPNFTRHQPIHPREAKSVIPEPPPVPNPVPEKANLGTPKVGPGLAQGVKSPPASTSTSTSTSTSEELLVADATTGHSNGTGKPASKRRASRDPPAGPPDWVNDAVEIYAKEIGYVTHGQVGKTLKPVVQRRGWEEVKSVLEHFCHCAPYEDYLQRMEANTLRPGEEKVKKLGYHTKLAALVERYTYWAAEAGVTP